MNWQKTDHGEHVTWHVREFVTLHRQTGKISWSAIGAVTVEDAKDFVSSVNEAIELAGGETVESLARWANDNDLEIKFLGKGEWPIVGREVPFLDGMDTVFEMLGSAHDLFTALSEAKSKLTEGE